MADESNAGSRIVYQHHFDRDKEADLEAGIKGVVRTLQKYAIDRSYNDEAGEQQAPLTDSFTIAEIQGLLIDAIILLKKYREADYAQKVVDFSDYLQRYKVFNAIDLLKNMMLLTDIVAEVLGDRHNFKDRTEREFKWEKELKKKWHLSDSALEGRPAEYYETIKPKWKRISFLASANMVVNDGDVYCLETGINNGGKTNDAILTLKQTNWYLRNFWHVKSDMAQTKELHPFSLARDVRYTPAPSDLDELLGDSQYNTKDMNEGMLAAINLLSRKKEVVEMGVNAFISRSKHNFLIFEYQVTKRPPKLLVERFNMWRHKMSLRYGVLSIPSGLYRKDDPLYFDELDKLRTDKEISNWMVHRNPNFITVYRAPHMKPAYEQKFKLLQVKAHMQLKQARETQADLTQGYTAVVKDMWERVNQGGNPNPIAFVELPSLLMNELHFNERQTKRFMTDFDKYDRYMKLVEWNMKGRAQEVLENG